jgi:hypothetical protein
MLRIVMTAMVISDQNSLTLKFIDVKLVIASRAARIFGADVRGGLRAGEKVSGTRRGEVP